MRFERDIVEGVHRVEDAYVNWYVVEEGRALTIVDAGHPASWRSLERVLFELRRGAADIEAIVLTHGHFDHVGFARRAQRELGVPVLAPHRDEPLVAHPWHYEHEHSRVKQALRHPSFARVFARMGMAGALGVDGCPDVAPYHGGERLPVPGQPKAIATPGHTLGHCSLELADRGLLIAGDAIVTFNPYTGGHGPQIVSGAATADSERALGSLTAIETSSATTIATGHGPVWHGEARTAVALARRAGPS